MVIVNIGNGCIPVNYHHVAVVLIVLSAGSALLSVGWLTHSVQQLDIGLDYL